MASLSPSPYVNEEQDTTSNGKRVARVQPYSQGNVPGSPLSTKPCIIISQPLTSLNSNSNPIFAGLSPGTKGRDRITISSQRRRRSFARSPSNRVHLPHSIPVPPVPPEWTKGLPEADTQQSGAMGPFGPPKPESLLPEQVTIQQEIKELAAEWQAKVALGTSTFTEQKVYSAKVAALWARDSEIARERRKEREEEEDRVEDEKLEAKRAAEAEKEMGRRETREEKEKAQKQAEEEKRIRLQNEKETKKESAKRQSQAEKQARQRKDKDEKAQAKKDTEEEKVRKKSEKAKQTESTAGEALPRRNSAPPAGQFPQPSLQNGQQERPQTVRNAIPSSESRPGVARSASKQRPRSGSMRCASNMPGQFMPTVCKQQPSQTWKNMPSNNAGPENGQQYSQRSEQQRSEPERPTSRQQHSKPGEQRSERRPSEYKGMFSKQSSYMQSRRPHSALPPVAQGSTSNEHFRAESAREEAMNKEQVSQRPRPSTARPASRAQLMERNVRANATTYAKTLFGKSVFNREVGDNTRTYVEGVGTPQSERPASQQAQTEANSAGVKTKYAKTDYTATVCNPEVGDMTRTYVEGMGPMGGTQSERPASLRPQSEMGSQNNKTMYIKTDYIETVFNRDVGDMTRTYVEGMKEPTKKERKEAERKAKSAIKEQKKVEKKNVKEEEKRKAAATRMVSGLPIKSVFDRQVGDMTRTYVEGMKEKTKAEKATQQRQLARQAKEQEAFEEQQKQKRKGGR